MRMFKWYILFCFIYIYIFVYKPVSDIAQGKGWGCDYNAQILNRFVKLQHCDMVYLCSSYAILFLDFFFLLAQSLSTNDFLLGYTGREAGDV